ncbi:MAG: hypothetical protein VXV74_03260, partial [Pseudomonadota bacterium]|nr:hypothetical protein [Pseudomonadota bacterium]
MAAYILRRLLLMIPTIFGIMAISFAIVQFAPGGPVERIIAQLQGHDAGATARFTSVNDGVMAAAGADANSACMPPVRPPVLPYARPPVHPPVHPPVRPP